MDITHANLAEVRTMGGPAPSRRTLLRAALAGAATIAAGCAGDPRPGPRTTAVPGDPSQDGTQQSEETTEMTADPTASVLLVYFSRAGENYHEGGRRDLEVGNTAVLAGMISDRVDCDVYEIEAADPYPEAYDPTVERNVREQESDARPAIAGDLPDVAGYDVVLLGSPVWNVRAPMIMSTFVEGVDLRGKSVLPFVTYAVSGMAGIDDDYRDALPDSDVGAGLAVRGETVADAGAELEDWLTAAGLLDEREADE
ncbi:flavodoxin [Cellulosimicrobium sp. Marseille-Q4280]|uniref:flavodoxin n=1 Tax=Cellulosimicrobium sp. Marseille-Q4280 TaxID=2937992 RepID=UPI00203E7F55|nr:flavodoxin [Cellulosimicrobium sp. Marseille-Q4280]